MKRKVTFWGGTFDPPHNGHLGIARKVLESKRSDLVLFVPAYAPPHKANEKISPYYHRVEMLRLALANEESMLLSEAEKELNASPSYTFLVMEYLEQLYAEDELQILIGGDSLAYLHTWHRRKELVQRWEILTFPRRDNANLDLEFLRNYWSDSEAQKLMKGVLNMPFFEISSTEVRKKVEISENTANSIPESVLNYIENHSLYKKEKNDRI